MTQAAVSLFQNQNILDRYAYKYQESHSDVSMLSRQQIRQGKCVLLMLTVHPSDAGLWEETTSVVVHFGVK